MILFFPDCPGNIFHNEIFYLLKNVAMPNLLTLTYCD